MNKPERINQIVGLSIQQTKKKIDELFWKTAVVHWNAFVYLKQKKGYEMEISQANHKINQHCDNNFRQVIINLKVQYMFEYIKSRAVDAKLEVIFEH